MPPGAEGRAGRRFLSRARRSASPPRAGGVPRCCYHAGDGRIDAVKKSASFPALTAIALTAACSLPQASREPQPPSAAPTESPAVSEAPPAATQRETQLAQQLALSDLRLLELEAQVRELQARLDEARLEVVRAMARQESQASRAEAASAMAEAEIALQSLAAAGGGDGGAEIERLIGLAGAAFDRGNYAGALYMAGQAKGAAFEARGPAAVAGGATLRTGERPFATPLPLQTLKGANVRDGPGTAYKVLLTLPPGAAVTGHSQAGEWLRIKDTAGRNGWIHQALVGRKP